MSFSASTNTLTTNPAAASVVLVSVATTDFITFDEALDDNALVLVRSAVDGVLYAAREGAWVSTPAGDRGIISGRARGLVLVDCGGPFPLRVDPAHLGNGVSAVLGAP